MPKSPHELQAEQDRLNLNYDRLRDFVFGSESSDNGLAPSVRQLGMQVSQIEANLQSLAKSVAELQDEVVALQHDKKILSWILGFIYAVLLPVAIKLSSLALGF